MKARVSQYRNPEKGVHLCLCKDRGDAYERFPQIPAYKLEEGIVYYFKRQRNHYLGTQYYINSLEGKAVGVCNKDFFFQHFTIIADEDRSLYEVELKPLEP
jgi:hypothetical protein